MVNSVAPVWDGNETWLVLGGAGLFGAFPLAYAVIVDALTIPLTLMLIGLIFRGVAFEFRFKPHLRTDHSGIKPFSAVQSSRHSRKVSWWVPYSTDFPLPDAATAAVLSTG